MVDDTNGHNKQHNATTNSRRRFLGGTAGALGILGVGGAFTLPVGATDPEPTGADEPPTAVENEFDNDVDILNFARTLEFLEARFYDEALDNIDDGDLLDMNFVEHVDDHVDADIDEVGEKIIDYLRDEIETIQEHEEIHAEVLGSVVEDLGGEPVEEPEFDFGETVEEPRAFIETAALLEDTGVAAYAGAASAIENADLIPPALSIHSVEGRHASFVRTVGGQTGFPNAFDYPLPRSDVEAIASQFIVD